jgi:glutathione S-transferase
MDPIEIHGMRRCPFAWRVRLVAREKGIPFEWLPYDVEPRDPRSERHNPDRRSPLLVHEGFTLVESTVIGSYLEEAFPGRPLLPHDPKERARLRLLGRSVQRLDEAEHGPVTDEKRDRVQAAYRKLEEALEDGRPWLSGAEPGLLDLYLWPLVSVLTARRLGLPDDAPRLREAIERARQRATFRETAP